MKDESASTPQYQAEVGYSVSARSQVSTSPKIAYHDRVWESLRNKHPDLESTDVEALMECCYGGQSVYEASRGNFSSFDREAFDAIMNMSQEEVEELLSDDFEEEDDE